MQWFSGQHEPLIPKELFDKCQEVWREKATHHQATKRYNLYLLRNLVYCYPCCTHPPKGETFKNYGKMRCQSQSKGSNRYYRCRARELGYDCEQGGVSV